MLDAAGGNGRYLTPPLHLISSRPATLGSTLAGILLSSSGQTCGHQVEPDVAELVERYGAGLTLLEWAARLVCDFVVSGGRR